MPRRIDIELTSSRDDATWTWRAAGAKAPRGTLAASIVPPGAKVGDVLRVDAEFFVDGIEVTGVVPPKGARKEPDRLELIVPARAEEPLITTTLASRSRDDRGPRRDGPRRDGPRRDAPRRDGEGRKRPDAGGPAEHREGERPKRREGAERPPRRTRPEPPPMPAVERPKAKRLRAGKAHRTALLESLPEEHRPIAEQVVLGGLPAVRQAIEKQNAERTAAGEPAISPGPLLEIAEKLVPKVRTAEWRDRAEAAQRDLDQLDLRDLRSVVSTADAAAKDEESRALAQSLKQGLAARVDAEHNAWLAELTATLDVGRIVRALRVSSRPPKAGAPLPADLANRLIAGASEALTLDAAPERWVAVLDALAFAPVRDRVIPASLPTELHADVRATIARLATRIPKIAHIFEIAPDPRSARAKPERRRPAKPKSDKPKSDKPKSDKPKSDEPKFDEPKFDEPKFDEPKFDEPRSDEPRSDEPRSDKPQDETAAPTEPASTEVAASEPMAPTEPASTEASEPEVVASTAEAPSEDTAAADDEVPVDKPAVELADADEVTPVEPAEEPAEA